MLKIARVGVLWRGSCSSVSPLISPSVLSVDDDGVFCGRLADAVLLKPLSKKYAHIFWGVFIKTR